MKKIRKSEITARVDIRHLFETCRDAENACQLPGLGGRLIECVGQSESIGFTFPGIC